MGLRLRIADVEPGSRICRASKHCKVAWIGGGPSASGTPIGPRDARTAGSDAGAGTKAADCEGMAYRLAAAACARPSSAMLWNREMLAGHLQVRAMGAGTRLQGRPYGDSAISFVVDPAHCQYCGDLSIEQGGPSHRLRRRAGAEPVPGLPRPTQPTMPALARHTRPLYRGHGRPRGAAFASSRRRDSAPANLPLRRAGQVGIDRDRIRLSEAGRHPKVRAFSACDIVADVSALVARWLALPPNFRGILWVGLFRAFCSRCSTCSR